MGRPEVSLGVLPKVPFIFTCFYYNFIYLFNFICLGIMCMQYLQSPLEMKSQQVVNGQWVLGTEPRSSAGAACVVSYWANPIFIFGRGFMGHGTHVEVRGQLAGVGPLFTPWGFQD